MKTLAVVALIGLGIYLWTHQSSSTQSSSGQNGNQGQILSFGYNPIYGVGGGYVPPIIPNSGITIGSFGG